MFIDSCFYINVGFFVSNCRSVFDALAWYISSFDDEGEEDK